MLPYLFVIVGVPGLKGADVGAAVPEDLMPRVSGSPGPGQGRAGQAGYRGADRGAPARRGCGRVLQEQPGPRFDSAIRAAGWYVLSARRADNLLREKLFERVCAVRVRAFARDYRSAELDMHFSLAQDLSGPRARRVVGVAVVSGERQDGFVPD